MHPLPPLTLVRLPTDTAPAQAALLQAKLAPPAARPDWVARPRLFARLDAGALGALTLLSAPAGSGKTTLLSAWAAQTSAAVAWVSLDPQENEPALFWAYLVAAVRRLAPGEDDAPPPLFAASIASPIAALCEAVEGVGREVVLVLDDYHLVTAEPIHAALELLLDRRPPTLHLVIATREEPPLSLARRRLHGELAELGAADLQLSAGEAAQLMEAMNLGLSPALLDALLGRTEGWVAGVKLVGLLLQRQAITPEQVAGLRGDQRYLYAYLVEEVLERQPRAVQDFLLATAVLERMSAPLCDALHAAVLPQAAHPPADALLDELHRANLFVVALDDCGEWYRYHALFQEALLRRLRLRHPAWEQPLHRRACDWYEAHGLPLEAAPHALATGDAERAVRLLERASGRVLLHGDILPLRGWVEQLPAAMQQSSIELCLTHAWSLAISGSAGALAQRLRELEELVVEPRHAEPTLVAGDVQCYKGNLLLLHATAAVRRGDAGCALAAVQQARGPRTGVIDLLRGTALYLTGDLKRAAEAYQQALATSQEAGSMLVALPALSNLALVEQRRGRLKRAMALCRQALQLADARPQPTPVAGGAYLALGVCCYERNELDAALAHIARGVALVGQWGSVLDQLYGAIQLARVQLARGDVPAAAVAVEQAEALAERYDLAWSKEAAELPALLVRVGAATGALGSALLRVEQLRRVAGRSPHPAPPAIRQAHDLASGRAMLAAGRCGEAAALLDRLGSSIDASGWRASVLEALALSACAHAALGAERTALDRLRRAVRLAADEGLVRVILDAGEAVAPLLRRLAQQPGVPAHLGTLLAVAPQRAADQRAPAFSAAEARASTDELVEPLRERELQILTLIAQGRSTAAIADTLCIGVGTVRWHIKNLYEKLGAHSRTEAVARARAHQLLR